MKNIILALIVFLSVAATVHAECDVKRAEFCRNELMVGASADEQNNLMLCILHLKFKSCISLADCNNDAVYGQLRVEVVNDINMLCNSDGVMMVASIATMLLAVLAMFFM
ncbi:uncharacterized protein LOC121380556 [Gigantopelta aegis]|uniref:uncharacterized protein LOC121380556 n=1 Tax=Gigantopelta aegis TaxID=1735272 RepID=UPI001B88CADD|nr:uncharacterized protein LOC121380556 [Gigantopelta aegis]XP_041365356.1 uncharacterized protein LOC121380556 [Gigantopelta aegis]